MLVAYVTAHGYGHLVRTCEVLRAVAARAPRLPVTVVAAAPPDKARALAPEGAVLRHLACDVGLAQRDALVIDEPTTAERWRAFAAGFDALADAEARALRACGARAVLGDVPPLAFAAAARAGVPALALTNFSWDWVYRHVGARCPPLVEAAVHAAACYRSAECVLALPFAGDLGVFRRRVDVGFVARRPRVARDEVRRRLGLPGGLVALLTFGGFGVPADIPVAPSRPGLTYLSPREIPDERLAALGLGYPEVIAAVDVLVTKPGYGTITDAIAGRTPVVYTERGDFPEYPVMVAEMPRYLPCTYLSNAELRAGRLAEAIDRVLAMPWPDAPALDGAERAAERLLERVG